MLCLWIIMLLLCSAITWTVCGVKLELDQTITNTKTPCSRVNNRTRVLQSVLFCDYIYEYEYIWRETSSRIAFYICIYWHRVHILLYLFVWCTCYEFWCTRITVLNTWACAALCYTSLRFRVINWLCVHALLHFLLFFFIWEHDRFEMI